MNIELLIALALSLSLTLVLEIGFFLLIGKRNKKDLLLIVAVNVITNPVVVLLFWLSQIYMNLNRIPVIMILELLAVYTEGRYYKKYGLNIGRPYIFSVSANTFSFGLGALLQLLF